MTDTELNRAVAKKLGICWHEALFKGSHICTHCGCFADKNGLDYFNPDFTKNAKVLLDAIKEKLGEERYMEFIHSITSYTDYRGYTTYMSIAGFIYSYILNPRSLCEKFLEFMEGK